MSYSRSKEVRTWQFGGDRAKPYRLFSVLAKEEYTVVTDQKDPHIIIMHGRELERFRNINKVRRTHGFDVSIVSYTGENIHPNREADYSFSYMPTDGKNFQYPMCSNLRTKFSPQEIERMDLEISELKASPKDKFCNFVYRNEGEPQTRLRREFCELLSRYRRVDCPSKSMNNMPNAVLGKTVFHKLEFISQYKFTIAFENTSADYYITEKIAHPFQVGSIPIYWGCPQVTEYYNPESFINCHDYDSLEAVVERVKEIDNNPELYQRYLSAPLVLPNSRLNGITKEALRERANLIIEDAVSKTRRSTFSKNLTYWWWLLKNYRRWYDEYLFRAGKAFLQGKIKSLMKI